MYPDGIDPVQSYTDQDTEEDFYAVCWTLDMATLSVLLVVGGKCGPIKVLDSHRMQAHCVLHGHGDAVNDIRTHPTDPALVLSSSKDESVRLWNVLGRCCVAVFAGERGHASEVLAGDFHPLGHCFATAGMDNTIKVWPLDGPLVADAISASYTHAISAAESASTSAVASFAPALCQFPAYSTDAVHSDYVDSCAFLGNLLVSRSTDSRLLLWSPEVSARLELLQSLAEEAELEPAGASATLSSDAVEDALLATADKWQHRESGPLLAGDGGEGRAITSGEEAALEGGATILAELPLPKSSLWFIRLSVDRQHRRIAAGNDVGGVFVWDPMAPGAVKAVTEADALRFAAGSDADAAAEDDDEDDEEDEGAAEDHEDGDEDEDEDPFDQVALGNAAASDRSSPAAGASASSGAVPAVSAFSRDQQGQRIAFLAASPLRPTAGSVLHLHHPKCTRPVRQTCFSPDGQSVVAVCDGGSVWRYDLC
jgi:WD40 repeat protein